MKRRYVYVWIYSLPALLASIILSVLLSGSVAGLLWIFVLGDNLWPRLAEKLLASLFFVACLALWLVFLSIAFNAGKRDEQDATLNAKHALAAVGGTVLLILLVVLHQWSVGNIGGRSASELCSEYCQGKGFAGSGMPPRDAGEPTCSCYDAQGLEVVKVPLREAGASLREGP